MISSSLFNVYFNQSANLKTQNRSAIYDKVLLHSERKLKRSHDLINIQAFERLPILQSNLILAQRRQNITMQTDIIRRTTLSRLDDSDEQALDLFDNLNPNSSNSPHHHNHQEEESQPENNRPLGRLSKMKPDSKKERKRMKKKEKRLQQLQRKVKEMEEGVLNIVTPLKKLKKKSKKSKGPINSDDEAMSHNAGSSQYSSESEAHKDLQDELLNLNPDAVAQDSDPSPKKRLKKSGRKMRIQQKQGFRVEQLGNDGEVIRDKEQRSYDDEEYSFDDIGKKNRKKKKIKPNVPTNEQIMNSLKDHVGVVESEGEQRQGVAYDNGLDTLYAMKDKRKGGIKINNKFFCDIQIDARDEEAQMPTPQTLQLQLKPKSSTHSSSRFTFLSKVETLKKQRGLQNNADMQEYQRRMQERAKQSMAKVVTSMISQDFHDDIELEVRVPTIARGKSADIINNTVFLKSFASKHEPDSPNALTHTKSAYAAAPPKREALSRQQFYKQIQEQTRMRRSKYISEEQLKDSFKKTNLGELEEARKRNQEKRRKEALSEEEEEGHEMNSEENKMEELLEQEERICGDIEGDEEHQQAENQNQHEEPNQKMKKDNAGEGVNGKEKLEEVEFKVNLKEIEDNQQMKEKDKTDKANEKEAQAMEEQEEEINAQNEVIDELASASEHAEEQLEEDEQDDEEQEEEEEQAMQEQNEDQQMGEQQEPLLGQNMIVVEPNEQEKKHQMELQEEGIMLRKRKIPDQSMQKHTHNEVSQHTDEPFNHSAPQHDDKQNAINLPNTEVTASKAHTSFRINAEQQEEFNNFKKLRKFAMVIAEKKKIREEGRRYASEFIEQQAEEGSDNEEHDDFIKKIDYDAEDKQYEGVDLDADLVELIDNAVDLNEEDEHEAFRKYLEDIRIKDREQIRKIIRGQFRSRHQQDELDIDEDERRRMERMEQVVKWMQQREEEDGQGIYLKPPEEEGANSDSDSEYHDRKRKKAEKEEDIQKIPEAEEKEMIERFLQSTLPSSRRDSRPSKIFNLNLIPQSTKMDKGLNKTICLSRLGSKNSSQNQPKIKKTSSLVNEIMSRTNMSKITQKTLTKVGRK